MFKLGKLTVHISGDAISIDILLRHGASPATTDNTHLTPLHWASIKASRPCIQRLVAAGADLSARDENGKTARDMADEIKMLDAYRLGLEDAGYALDGFKIQPFLDEVRLALGLWFCFRLTEASLSIIETYTACHLARTDRVPWRSLRCIRLPSALRWTSARICHILCDASCAYYRISHLPIF